MTITKTDAGTYKWDLKLKGWDQRKRHTFKTYEEAEAHELQTILDHKLGKPYRPPTHTDSKAKRSDGSIGELVEFVDRIRWSQQSSAKREHTPSHVHPSLRYAELFRDWVG